MDEGMQDELARQVARLLEEAERPMRVEEILPHLDPIMPSPNDVAETLDKLASHKQVRRDGSYFARSTPLPFDSLFAPSRRDVARAVVEIIREIDATSGEGARLPAVLRAARNRGIDRGDVLDVLTVLRNAGEAYSVGGDRLRLAKP